MRTLCHLTLATALFAPSAALAAGEDATLKVENKFDGEAEVFVDGRFEGIARPNATTAFEVRSGRHEVVVDRPGTRFVLADAHLEVGCHQAVTLPVTAPLSSVRVENQGEIALKIEVGANTVWLQPNTSTILPVRAGNAEIQASAHEPRGDWKAVERQLWVEPGQQASTTLKPDPTVIVVVNRESAPVRALLDGADAGWIQPGDGQRMWVRPGPTNVVIIDRAGKVLSSTPVVVSKGQDARVVVGGPIVAVIH